MGFLNFKVRAEKGMLCFQVCSCFAAVGAEVDLSMGGLILTSEQDGKREKSELGGLIEPEGETVIKMGTEDAVVTVRDLVGINTCWLL